MRETQGDCQVIKSAKKMDKKRFHKRNEMLQRGEFRRSGAALAAP